LAGRYDTGCWKSDTCFCELCSPFLSTCVVLTHRARVGWQVSIPAPAVVHIGKTKDATKDKDKERERQVEKERQAALAAKQQLAAAGAIK
jgi:hypothetical protein